ncbi:MAG TPA: apolipoprotein N-acyltransferase [Steroidobacteraceae bacterium]|nr:apolipoprotein N-acyltransferase [Steroidobacteraceae bacterium]
MSAARFAGLTTWGPWAAALVAGALLPLAFAPFNLWPLAIACPASLMLLWQQRTPGRAAALGLCFGAGYFGAGTWWLYISIHDHGPAPVWLSLTLVLLVVAFMASYYGLLGWLTARFLPAAGPWRQYAALPAAWLLMEWLRGWVLSGFPWLSLGYSQTDTWLRAYAPVVGVYGLSALLLLQAGVLMALWQGRSRTRLVALALAALIWGGGAALERVTWTEPRGAPVPVAVVQGAIPQDEKWQLDNRVPTMALYRTLNDQALGARLIVWPEAAIPELANEIPRYLADIQASARSHGSDVVMGAVRLADNGEDYYNSILALTDNVVFYDKRHLVPFAEYFPVPAFVRRWLRFMSLPYSDFTSGSALQGPLVAGGLSIAPSICYEDAFGSAQRFLDARSDLLVNVTNDAWFGRSPARYQHLQIARMRAIEAGRYLVRAGNDGVSAFIGPQGELVALAPEYRSAVLRGTVVARRGLSPYLRFGNWPVLLLGLLALAMAAWKRRNWVRPESR